MSLFVSGRLLQVTASVSATTRAIDAPVGPSQWHRKRGGRESTPTQWNGRPITASIALRDTSTLRYHHNKHDRHTTTSHYDPPLPPPPINLLLCSLSPSSTVSGPFPLPLLFLLIEVVWYVEVERLATDLLVQ